MSENPSGHGGARPGAGRPKGRKDEKLIRAPGELARKITAIAAARGESVADYLGRKLAATVDREFARLAEDA